MRSHESGQIPNAHEQLPLRARRETVGMTRMKRNNGRIAATIERLLEIKVYRGFPRFAIESHQKIENE
jgi:hypothetical protein